MSKPPFAGFNLAGFWNTSEYAIETYVEHPPTETLVAEVETELGYRLPASYVVLMRTQNGGIPVNNCFPSKTPTSWAADHVAISDIPGIGRTKPYSLVGPSGTRFMQEEWGYPTWGVCICNCPSAGHDMIMLDYRECGPRGEPTVVHVDQGLDYRVTPLASDFETFVRGLVPESDYEVPAEEVLARELEKVQKGAFKEALAVLLRRPEAIISAATFRHLLEVLVKRKQHFSLHEDPQSQLVYDTLFALHSEASEVRDPQGFLDVYPELIVFGEGEVCTGGYAPIYVESWLKERLEDGAIEYASGAFQLSAAHRTKVVMALADFESGSPKDF